MKKEALDCLRVARTNRRKKQYIGTLTGTMAYEVAVGHPVSIFHIYCMTVTVCQN